MKTKSCGIKYHLCWNGERKSILVYVEQNVFIGIVIFSPDVYILHNGAGSVVVFQNRQVMVASLGCCCKYRREYPPESRLLEFLSGFPDCWNFLEFWGKMVEGEIEDDRGMLMKDECVFRIRNLGGRLVIVV